MKNIDEITTEVLNWVYEKFPLAKNNKISDNDSLLESGIVDSLGILDIVAFLEETFSIQLSDEDMVAAGKRRAEEFEAQEDNIDDDDTDDGDDDGGGDDDDDDDDDDDVLTPRA